jgi:hypothetical protein
MTPEVAKDVVDRLLRLQGGAEVLRKAAARMLARLSATEATGLLHEVMALARGGWVPATQVLPAFTQALEFEAASIPHTAALRRVAQLEEHDDVELLFVEGPAQREYHRGAAAKADGLLFSQTLGHLKTLARLTRNVDELSRLAVVSNPQVIRNLLINPRLTEAVVVRIAARRPARPEPLLEIWRSPRWSTQPAVRRALVFNPYLPPEIGSKIVPLLLTGDLRELSGDSALAPALREQANVLLRTGRRAGG